MTKMATKPPTDDLYQTDFYAWTQEQARVLRAHDWSDLDLRNLIEEVESLGGSNKREIENRLVVLVAHLLKWKYQPGVRSTSWRGTIAEQRLQIQSVVRHSPSLRRYPAKVFLDQYLGARLLANKETGIAFDLFPVECPFSIEETLDLDFLPEEPGHIGRG